MGGVPEVRYARSGDVSIAYQVFGEGDIDLVLVPGFFSHVEMIWDFPPMARCLRRLASFARVAMFDRRGSGLSDPVAAAPTLEERMDDARAVMDAAGMDRAAVFGWSEGGAMSILLAAAHPDRVGSLVIYAGTPRTTYAPDYDFALAKEDYEEGRKELIAPFWGTGATLEIAAPSNADNEEFRRFFGRMERASASPRMFAQLVEMYFDIDVREAARAVRVPTLLLHRRQDLFVNVRHSRWLAENMPNAEYVELEGTDHNFWADPDDVIGEMQRFLTGSAAAPEPDRILATVLFTDIVESTQRAVDLGDATWREVLHRHESAARAAVQAAGGRVVKWTGDGLMATFDGPGRAIAGAREIRRAAAAEGIGVRAGLHTGEIELIGDDVGGIGVHIAARVGALAGDGDILVSRTVKDLVAGSSLTFEDRGTHALKGVPEAWSLYAVAGPG
jgi:pimeloyl-ACP methyl ester carboxylesterase